MSSYKNKLTPPKNVQRKLLNEGYVFQVATPCDGLLWEEHLRYRTWCRHVVKSIQRKMTVKRKDIRKAKRFFAYNDEDVLDEEDQLTCEAIE